MQITKDERKALLESHGNRCDNCGQSHRRLHAHHTDYSSKPTQVLCPSCHRKLHSELRVQGNIIPNSAVENFPITFRLRPYRIKRLNKLCERLGITKSEAVRRGIELLGKRNGNTSAEVRRLVQAAQKRLDMGETK